jgi:ubiquinone/menaquinone biosynthesis C-methylase UbiE
MQTKQPPASLPYASKAEKYARYRWDYAPEAIRTIVATTNIGPQSAVADLGAGTGILTRHFVEVAGLVYAVEPDEAMLTWARRSLSGHPSFRPILASAEATSLPAHSVDLILAGQALHWFEPDTARREFMRILKPGGWLAVVWNHPADPALGNALSAILTAENGWDATPISRPPQKPFSFYFGSDEYTRLTTSAMQQETWDEFLGSLCSDSHAPDGDHPAYPQLARAARQVFDQFSRDGWVAVRYATELCLGQMADT